jgi:cyanobactin maturation PatA/PatG family protease
VFVAALNERFAAAWSATLGDERICIAVLDGPVERSHVAFKGARLTEIKDRSSSLELSTGFASEHGTHVASIIFGQHGSPVTGIAPRCRGLLIPIFGNAPDGGVLRCTQVELADAITAAVNRGAHIINISGGEFTASGTFHPTLGDVLDRCDQQGVLIVAAAGNDGCDCLHVPAAHPSILAVGAATAAGQPLEWSNWGSQYQRHGLLALGENVRGAAPGGKISQRSGTSSAAALVSGVAGLLMSLDIQHGIKPNGPRIRQLLLHSSDPCPSASPSACRRYLSGVLNVERAVSLLSEKAAVMNLNESNSDIQSHFCESTSTHPPQTSGSAHQTYGPTPFGCVGSIRGGTSVDSNMTEVAPATCACRGGGAPAPKLVFALGQIGYSFSSQARVDSLRQHMSPLDPLRQTDLFTHLTTHRYDATSVIWTLEIDSVPVYAISLGGPNSRLILKELWLIMAAQTTYKYNQSNGLPLSANDVERVSVAGALGGWVSLMTGARLPVIHPELRGVIRWNTDDFAKKVAAYGKAPTSMAAKVKVVARFLERICFDFRNLGLTSRDRAINFVATNPHGFAEAFTEAANAGLKLHTIEVVPSLVCRPGSECWDVRLEYFDPNQQTDVARRVYRVTVDVSDVVPVVVGEPRYWSIAE